MRNWFAAVPASVAALLLTVLPACSGRQVVPDGVGPIENPHVTARVAPRDADIPVRLQRAAGEFCPPSFDANAATAIFYLFVLIGYILYWVGDAIWEAAQADTGTSSEEATG